MVHCKNVEPIKKTISTFMMSSQGILATYEIPDFTKMIACVCRLVWLSTVQIQDMFLFFPVPTISYLL